MSPYSFCMDGSSEWIPRKHWNGCCVTLRQMHTHITPQAKLATVWLTVICGVKWHRVNYNDMNSVINQELWQCSYVARFWTIQTNPSNLHDFMWSKYYRCHFLKCWRWGQIVGISRPVWLCCTHTHKISVSSRLPVVMAMWIPHAHLLHSQLSPIS